MRQAGLLLSPLVLIGACSAPPVEPWSEVTVIGVVDGDTIDVEIAGAGRERVRLIGIDTPESVIPGEAPECFGPEAAARLSALLPEGTPVSLERDVEARDPYGRLLAYVYRADDMINLQLAGEGFADALSIPPNTAWADQIARSVALARQQRAGLWGACTL